ncbi:hypothetical protein PUMCH_000105 [Australozyma saopauloensis]|uniref:Translation initiation factor IF-2, mitochondrial n=1 Tax=Australozyma saopauloensis TaxID=291208 RepID=A0AAX4H3W8_9ASCO|nr:hypothetical protein PUMCH_000105 [[Candida] saopauloensis]
MYSRAALLLKKAGTEHWASRPYSSFKDLPKVGPVGGNKPRPNRFAEMYDKKSRTNNGQGRSPEQNTQHNNRNFRQNGQSLPYQGSTPRSRQDATASQHQEYSRLKQRFNEEKQRQKEYLQPSSKPQAVKKRRRVREPVKITIPPFVTVSTLSSILNVPLSRFLKRLEKMGYEEMTHHYILDKENASLIADEFGFEATVSEEQDNDLLPAPVDESKLKPRPPVVTIMGHVDHGKTTILDYLRKSAVVDSEFGGITQHIGAFSVMTPVSKKKITFLDTPGHSAFLSMRERGAIVTDIVILVVAADDSVMPQTIEAIKHAQKSNVPIIVAINKCDKPSKNIEKVLNDLSRYGVDIEDYGGETQTVQVSGKTGLNMDKLEEAVITLSELSDFQAEPTGVPAEGWVIESQVVTGLGNIATVLVKRGTMKVGSYLVAGTTYCKIRGMKDEFGKTVKVAGPSTPVRVWGWKDLPLAGDRIIQADLEPVCKKVVQAREDREKQQQTIKDIDSINKKRKQEVEEMELQEKINERKLAGLDATDLIKETEAATQKVHFIVKSDVYGSAEAIKESIEGLGNDEVQALVIFFEAGPPTKSDLEMASALDAQILCFNVKVPKAIQAEASQLKVKILEQNIIYRLIEHVTEDLTSRLKPHIDIKILAELEIRAVYDITAKNKAIIKIAGCKVNNGTLKRSSQVRVKRNGKIVFTGELSSLKHVKDDVTEVKKGLECGLQFDKWSKFEAGDAIEAFEEVEVPRFL